MRGVPPIYALMCEPTQAWRFGERTGLHIYLQPAGPASAHLLWPAHSQLDYALPRYDLRLAFLPTDFTQVNREINAR